MHIMRREGEDGEGQVESREDRAGGKGSKGKSQGFRMQLALLRSSFFHATGTH